MRTLATSASPSAVGSPTFRHYAALRAGPRTSGLPASALPSRPPSGRPLRVRLAVSDFASAPCVGPVGESQDQERLRRAGSESRGTTTLPGCGRVRGWWGPVGCAPFAWHLKATRNLPGAQPAAAFAGGAESFAGCTPGRTTGRATPARRREHPNLGRNARSAPGPTPSTTEKARLI